MFDGNVGGRGRVNLGGQGGRRDEGRAEFVRRQQKEREAREQRRIRERAATLVQAVFRSFRCVRAAKALHRQIFDKRRMDIGKVWQALPEETRAKFVFRALVPMMRLFAFFFSGSVDQQRVSGILDLVLFCSKQAVDVNIFHMIADESQRPSILFLIKRLLAALLSLGDAQATELLLSLRRALAGCPAESVALAHMMTHTDAARYLSGSALPRAMSHPALGEQPQAVVDLVTMLSTGLWGSGPLYRDRQILALLSTPNLCAFLNDRPGAVSRDCLALVAQVVSSPPAETCAALLEEEIHGSSRRVWLVANMLTLLESFMPTGNLEKTPAMIEWLGWAREGNDPALKAQLDRLDRPNFVRAIQQALSTTTDLFVLCKLYFCHKTQSREPPLEVLQTLAFSTPMARQLFPVVESLARRPLESVMEALGAPAFSSADALQLRVFCTVYAFQMQPVYDSEFFADQNPLSRSEVDVLGRFLNRTAYHLVTTWPSQELSAKALRTSIVSLLRSLCDRHRRHRILSWDNSWIIPNSRQLILKAPLVDLGGQVVAADMDVDPEDEDEDVDMSLPSAPKVSSTEHSQILEAVLEEIPHVLQFEDRVTLLHNVIAADQESRQDTRGPWAQASRRPHRIRRNFLVEDGHAAFDVMSDEGSLKDVFRVEFVAPDGELESGIDGGGLFKEFMIHVCRATFDPEFGLFKATSEQTLVPSAKSVGVHGASEKYEFLGKVVGKAIYEMMLVEQQFSGVFLNKLLGRTNEVDDVSTLDRELYRSMLRLKHEDVDALSLTFSVSNELDKGETDLIPNGRNIPVTKENLTRYLHLFAHHKTNVQIHSQTAAFVRGLQCVIPLSWLRMFDPYELNILISGSWTGFDVQDLCRHTVYSGGYEHQSPTVHWLWQLLQQLDSQDMQRFLMFVTSCSRAPLLGFKTLHPKFCVHRVPDGERLPTASTCANLLKLPDYTCFEVLKTKVLQAIRAEAGFELS